MGGRRRRRAVAAGVNNIRGAHDFTSLWQALCSCAASATSVQFIAWGFGK